MVGWFRSSNSTRVIMPSEECRHWRLWKISRYSKSAVTADVYSHVTTDLAIDSAERIAAILSGASEVPVPV